MIARAASGRILLFTLTFGFLLTIRVWGISTHFWMLEDQIRDWDIAMRPFSQLPLVGPPTHVHGYTIGPAFYWILWSIRVVLGPWFDNLPHAGGIGHAILQSLADVLLLSAIWRRTGSPWLALAAVIFLATAAYDLCLAPLVWNPVMGSILAKTAFALVLLDWPRNHMVRVAVVALVAWAAVQAYTGAVFVTVGVIAALLLDASQRSGTRGTLRAAIVMSVTVLLLQVPYLVHQFAQRFSQPAMAAVTGGIRAVVTGQAAPELSKSITGYVAAVRFIEFAPRTPPLVGLLLLACAVIVVCRYRHDPPLLALLLLPQLAAIAGFALFLGALDHYYYLSLMPAPLLTVVFAVTFVTPVSFMADGVGRSQRRWNLLAGVVLLTVAVLLAPAKIRYAATLHKMPEYKVLVDASRHIRNRDQPMRAIQADFVLPPTCDPGFIYRVLGGKIDRRSEWVAIIQRDATVRYVQVQVQP
jgi:hypothetical protein